MRYTYPTRGSLERFSDRAFSELWTSLSLPEPVPVLVVKNGLNEALERIFKLPPEDFERLNEKFDAVFRLDGADGVNAFLIAAGDRREELRAELADLKTDYDRTLWAILKWPHLAELAEDIFDGDSLRYRGPRYVNRYRAKSAPALTADNVDTAALEAAIAQELRAQNLPVDRLLIEVVGRNDGAGETERLIQFTIRHGGPAETVSDFTDASISEKRFRPVRDCFIYFSPETGRLDVAAEKLGAKARHALANRFCEVALAQTPPDRVAVVPVSLGSLLQRREFPTDPIDGIESVMLARLTSSTRSGYLTTLAVPLGDDVWTMEEFVVLMAGSPLVPSQAWLRITLAPKGAGKNSVTRTVRLSTPNGASFPHATAPEKRLFERCLQRWGLINAPD